MDESTSGEPKTQEPKKLNLGIVWDHFTRLDCEHGENPRVACNYLAASGKGKEIVNTIGPPTSSLYVTCDAFFTEIMVIQSSITKLCANDDENLQLLARGMKQIYEAKHVEDLAMRLKNELAQIYDWYVLHDSIDSVQTQNLGDSSKRITMDEDDDTDVFEKMMSQFKKHLEEESNMSELERFLMEDCEEDNDNFDILFWWKANSSKYCILSHLARDVLAILVPTVASRSAFSTGGRVLDPFHSSLSPSMVEALICSQNWLRSPAQINLRDQLDELEKLASDLKAMVFGFKWNVIAAVSTIRSLLCLGLSEFESICYCYPFSPWANAASGMAVEDDCKLKFFELKTKRNYRFIIFKIEGQNVAVEKLGSPEESYEDFTASLPADECRYAVFDFDFITDENCQKSKIFFIAWSPDTSKVRMKMVYASSKDRFKRELDGIQVELQATDPSEMSFDIIKARAI
ncbi:unnamed protein product [Camellia sinensis]